MPIPTFDVLVIGSGAAGLYAALCLPQHYQVALITKDVLSQSASDWAQGGIAAAITPDDSPLLHWEDTLQAGAGLCEPDAVKLLVDQGADCIRSLVELGVPFDRTQGQLALTLEAAHSRKRVLHAADATGRAVVSTLAAAIRQRSNITVFEHTLVLDLWRVGDRCQGAIVADAHTISRWRAKAVVLATGGGGQVFSQTTNPPASTGDGVAMAWRVGAQLRDLEFFQFHPTALKIAGAPRFLISEAVRGEGAHLIDADGERFAFAYHPQGELAPRDVVSRAIYQHLAHQPETEADWVWLDLSPIPRARMQYRFPNIINVCQKWGIDPYQQPIPVSPAAHYWMGGIVTDRYSGSSLSQLYAVGETASTGVHGANRLASNSLLECLVYGRQLQHLQIGEAAIAPTQSDDDQTFTVEVTAAALASLQALRTDIPDLIWQGAGISRHGKTLSIISEAVAQRRAQFGQLSVTQQLLTHLPAEIGDVSALSADTLRLWNETRNLLDLAHLILQSATFREESRGGHYREDYSEAAPDWQVHTLVQGDRWWRSGPVTR